MAAPLPDFGGFRRIVQSPDPVSIFYDTGQGQGWPRNIPCHGASASACAIRQWWGDSRGRWEGNTLVVDVTNFSPKTDFQGARENLHLVERWTRLDANTIEYAVTIEDPTTWTRPWTVKQELKRQRRAGESDLLRAAMSRGKLRPGGDAPGAARRGAGVQGRTRPRSGDKVQRLLWILASRK